MGDERRKDEGAEIGQEPAKPWALSCLPVSDPASPVNPLGTISVADPRSPVRILTHPEAEGVAGRRRTSGLPPAGRGPPVLG
jgi:hypothetical protein